MTRTHRHRRGGFSLLELTVTLVLLGVIIGIATVSWSSFSATTKRSSAGALLDRVVLSEGPIARDWGSYTAWPSDLSDVGDDAVILNGTPSKGPTQVSVVVGSQGSLALAVKLPDGSCLYRVVAPLDAGAGSSTPDTIAGSAACTGQSALPDAEQPLVQTASIKTAGN